jgi:Family of unknown function (DUF6516)
MEEPPDGTGLSYLLDLDGLVAEVGGGFWIKACVYRVEASESAPHGISYSLTLHSRSGQRVVGYDNAHPFSRKRGMRQVVELTNDHKHYRDRLGPYPFESAAKLMEDFWTDVARFLQEEGVEG